MYPATEIFYIVICHPICIGEALIKVPGKRKKLILYRLVIQPVENQ